MINDLYSGLSVLFGPPIGSITFWSLFNANIPDANIINLPLVTKFQFVFGILCHIAMGWWFDGWLLNEWRLMVSACAVDLLSIIVWSKVQSMNSALFSIDCRRCPSMTNLPGKSSLLRDLVFWLYRWIIIRSGDVCFTVTPSVCMTSWF